MTSQRGTVSIIAATGALVLCLTALGAADLGSMVYARVRAQAAADAAALAAAVAQVPILGREEDPDAAARAEAERNGATLVRCTCDTGTPAAEVEVEVVPRLTYVSTWFGRAARAIARAEVDPDVLSWREPG